MMSDQRIRTYSSSNSKPAFYKCKLNFSNIPLPNIYDGIISKVLITFNLNFTFTQRNVIHLKYTSDLWPRSWTHFHLWIESSSISYAALYPRSRARNMFTKRVICPRLTRKLEPVEIFFVFQSTTSHMAYGVHTSICSYLNNSYCITSDIRLHFLVPCTY